MKKKILSLIFISFFSSVGSSGFCESLLFSTDESFSRGTKRHQKQRLRLPYHIPSSPLGESLSTHQRKAWPSAEVKNILQPCDHTEYLPPISHTQCPQPQTIEEETLVDLMEHALNKEGCALYHMGNLYQTGFIITNQSRKINPLRALEKLNTCLFEETPQKQALKPQEIEEETLVDLMEHALNKEGSALYHMGNLYQTGFIITNQSGKRNPLRALEKLNTYLFDQSLKNVKDEK